jgi:hypothetical protein
MRASDVARERAAALLRRRCDEGYLSLDTFERRLEAVYRARSTDELAGLTADLPAIGLFRRLGQWRLGRGRDPLPAADHGVRLPLELVGERPLVLGRSRYCDVTLKNATVSRTHAELRRLEDGWSVRDLGSSNGTWIDGRLVAGTERVAPGQQIALGDCPVRLL